jgi:hypothetical protein
MERTVPAIATPSRLAGEQPLGGEHARVGLGRDTINPGIAELSTANNRVASAIAAVHQRPARGVASRGSAIGTSRIRSAK